MKRLLFVALVCGLAAMPSLGASSLGFWNEGDRGSVHLFWNLEPSYVLEVLPVQSFIADTSEAVSFPTGIIHSPIAAAIIRGPGLTYHAGTGSFSSLGPIEVHLSIHNFDAQNPYKEVWVDVLGSGTVEPTGVMALDHGVVSFSYELLSGPGPGTGADFGWRLRPNPVLEEVEFTVHPAAAGLEAVLNCLHVDTFCVPAPGALLLASLGAAAIGWLRIRRSL